MNRRLFQMDHWLSGPQKKMLFVSIWASFAVALFLLNQEKKRKTYMTIPDFKPWKAVVLVVTGFVGGVLTSFTGSGVDICIFSVITVLFRVSEKSATPTTIVLMGKAPYPIRKMITIRFQCFGWGLLQSSLGRTHRRGSVELLQDNSSCCTDRGSYKQSYWVPLPSTGSSYPNLL